MQGYPNEAFREAIVQKLLKERSAILNQSSVFEGEGRPEGGDEADHAASEINLNLSLSLRERERSLLQKIDRALSKIEKGTYGECEACGELLNPKRLYARPVATLCIDCKEEQEDLQKLYA